MKNTSASKSPSTAERDFREQVALEIAAMHARQLADKRLTAISDKLRQVRHENALLRAEKRALQRELAQVLQEQADHPPSTLTEEEQAERLREIFKVECPVCKARQEAERDTPAAL
jgi:hypothetical protein